MRRRHIESAVLAALSDTPVVLISGARQTGKTTLARTIAARTGARYLTFDDAATLGLAAADPAGFVGGLPARVVLDEIQKATTLFPAIKLAVDRYRQPGRFLLTGSASVLTLPACRTRSRAGWKSCLSTRFPRANSPAGARASRTAVRRQDCSREDAGFARRHGGAGGLRRLPGSGPATIRQAPRSVVSILRLDDSPPRRPRPGPGGRGSSPFRTCCGSSPRGRPAC